MNSPELDPFFSLEASDGKARAGRFVTEHGVVETPIFMPVGTRGSVKCVGQDDLENIGAQILLGNTYHLLLRPGHELIERVSGGLHEFMSWPHPILTDSGGFQVFSLSNLNKVTEDGVEFKSHLDGAKYFLGPESSMEIQRALGSDIVMCFDECPALPATSEQLRKSLELTMRWAKRCKDYELRPYQKLFGIVQGGLDLELRRESLERLEELDFPGLAIGGLSVGEKNDEMREFLENFVFQMPHSKPRYLMGVGKPLDVLHGIKNGVDMFDCVLPTRNARNGQVFTKYGPLNIKKERFKEDLRPLDPDFDNPASRRYSRAYLCHLFRVGEYLAGQVISQHNIWFYLNMVQNARAAIRESRFDEFYETFYKNFTSNAWK
mgnify:CR=1 FL=1